jgi:hypothetical protein
MTDSILKEAIDVVSAAKARGIDFRILGSVAVAFHASHPASGRPAPIKDIDLITRSETRVRAQKFLLSEGWILAKELLMLAELRETYRKERKGPTLDVYYDKTDGNHSINLRSRLNMSFPTIPIIDLLLTKLQRQKPRTVDQWDSCQLLIVWDGRSDSSYFTSLIGRDWGFYTTVTENLEKLQEKCIEGRGSISSLLELARNCRKSARWHIRALVGRRIKWWTEVYETRISAR